MSETILSMRVVHPLDDAAEEKLFRPEMGRLELPRGARMLLLLLRLYLAAMLMLIGAHFLLSF